MTTVTKEEYWPAILNDATQAGQIATDDAEWNKRAACIYEVLKNTLCTCTNKILIQQWEATLGISPEEGASQNDRKAACLYNMTSALPLNQALIEKSLELLLGAGNFELTIDNDTQKATLSLFYDVLHKWNEVDILMRRVVPQPQSFQITDMPLGYRRLEYLESTGTQYIDTGLLLDNGSELTVDCEIDPNSGVVSGAVFGFQNTNIYQDRAGWSEFATGMHGWVFWGWLSSDQTIPSEPQKRHSVELSRAGLYWNGVKLREVDQGAFKTSGTCWLFARNSTTSVTKYYGKIYSFTFSQDGKPQLNFVPALDPTGAPCMFDRVTRKAFYNSGAGDFTYPNMEQQATTYSLRRRDYAQMTKQGIRRLYHVPKGCELTKEEYAEQNGFKILVETPQPEEGYWMPVWHEHEDCIELEWVETEPPAEEIMEQENIATE